MAKKVRDLMTPNPIGLPASSSVVEAARAMRDGDIGPVLVLTDGDRVRGIVTDRDIVVRVIAEGKDPETTKLADLASEDLTSVSPDASAEEAMGLMRDKGLRRLPVVEGVKAVGILSLGDLATERDPKSVLGQISAAPPNN